MLQKNTKREISKEKYEFVRTLYWATCGRQSQMSHATRPGAEVYIGNGESPFWSFCVKRSQRVESKSRTLYYTSEGPLAEASIPENRWYADFTSLSPSVLRFTGTNKFNKTNQDVCRFAAYLLTIQGNTLLFYKVSWYKSCLNISAKLIFCLARSSCVVF